MRWIDQFFLTILLLISAALIVLWFRSQSIGDRYRWLEISPTPEGGVFIESQTVWLGEGGVALATQRTTTQDPDAAQRIRRRAEQRARFDPPGYSRSEDPRYPTQVGSTETLLDLVGVHHTREQRDDGTTQRELISLTIPLWLPMMLALAYPLVRFFCGVVRRERLERIALGLCPRCGFNVRAAPESCPICGKRLPLGVAATATTAPAR